MPPATRRFRLRAPLAGLALLAGCGGFSEGPDWPPLATQEEPVPVEAPVEAPVAAPVAAPAEAPEAEPKWPSLAELALGQAAPPAPGGGALLVGRVRPLILIRFAEPAVDYEKALYGALRAALKRRPQTAFDLVAVAPRLPAADPAGLAGGTRAVLRSLEEMGLPTERLSVSATAYPGVLGNEVHLYVR
jgi:hypothetical protein